MKIPLEQSTLLAQGQDNVLVLQFLVWYPLCPEAHL